MMSTCRCKTVLYDANGLQPADLLCDSCRADLELGRLVRNFEKGRFLAVFLLALAIVGWVVLK